jgi:hypothetical protein
LSGLLLGQLDRHHTRSQRYNRERYLRRRIGVRFEDVHL